jgi:hypothetical protein
VATLTLLGSAVDPSVAAEGARTALMHLSKAVVSFAWLLTKMK